MTQRSVFSDLKRAVGASDHYTLNRYEVLDLTSLGERFQ
jgi:hypothetical protein